MNYANHDALQKLIKCLKHATTNGVVCRFRCTKVNLKNISIRHHSFQEALSVTDVCELADIPFDTSP